jgi:hypothetical protein
MKIRIGLAEGWKGLHKKSTVRFSALIAIIAPCGPLLREVWATMPDDLKTVIPQDVRQGISYAILACTFLALRYTRFEKKGRDDERTN